jgi:capsular exopolysaccharide synthesis family protein
MTEDQQLQPAGLRPSGPQPVHSQPDGLRSNQRRPREEPHLFDYARVVVKRRHVALAVFAAIFLASVVYSFTATPLYEGRVQLLIESDNPNVVNFKEVIDEAQSRQDYYQTQYKLLQSRSLAKQTIETLGLWNNEELSPPAAKTHFSIGNTVRASAAVIVGLFGHKVEREAPAPKETEKQVKAIDAFLDRLTVTPVRNSRLVEVSYRSKDPEIASKVANGIATTYIEQNLDFRYTASRDASEWLNQQLEEQRRQVEAAEAALQQYREQNDALSVEDRQNIVVQKLADLNSAVTKAKTDRLLKESMYRQLAAIEHDAAALDTFPAILANQFIQQQKAELASLQRQRAQLGEKLGERHPEMLRIQSAIQASQMKLDGEIAKVVQSVRTEYQAARAQEQSLTAALESQKGEALSMNRKAIDYNVLERDVHSSKEIYQSLLQRAKETGVSGALKTSNIRIVDAADVSTTPVSPRRMINLLIGLFGGLFCGIAVAFFFEYMDNRIKTPEELESLLGLPSMALIPKLTGEHALKDPLINNGVPANFAEAFRGLRTNVLFSFAEDGARSVVVTSTGPGEGKTTVACNLALGMAMAGQRVLLIDADMRRPRVHEALHMQREPGLSNLLVGAAKANDVMRKTSVPNFYVLPAGTTPPNPAELLGSKRFADLLASLREHFDLVVIDTPPVMAVTDAAVIGYRASGVLFVAAADATSRHAAQTALDQLEHARVRFIGAVLNRVDLQGNAYYYSKYYRKEYAGYYTAAAS